MTQLETYLNSKLPNVDYTKNYLQRESLKIFKQIVIAVGANLLKKKELSKEGIQDYIMQKYFLTDGTAKRYITRLIASKIFDYDEHTGIFKLPSEVEVTDNAQ